MTLLGVLHQGENLPGTAGPDGLNAARLADLADVVRHVPQLKGEGKSVTPDLSSDQRLMREIQEANPERLRVLGQEAVAVQEAARLLSRVMAEFDEDGEPFRPQEDPELKNWLDDLLQREVTNLNSEDRALLLDSLLGFPPVTPAEIQYGDERAERTRTLLTEGSDAVTLETALGATDPTDLLQAA